VEYRFQACFQLQPAPLQPGIVFAYHGTLSCNADAIMSGGFCCGKRSPTGDGGVYFSGRMSVSALFAQHSTEHENHPPRECGSGSGLPGDVILCALIDSRRMCQYDVERDDPVGGVLSCCQAVFPEDAALPLARLRGL
jgi:hypothetical protein